jgi:hypothetical protein
LRGYRSGTHTTPDTSKLVWRVADDVRDTEILYLKHDREVRCGSVPAVADILKMGEKKLRSSSIKTFNMKLDVLRGQNIEHGSTFLDEIDELSQPDFVVSVGDDED